MIPGAIERVEILLSQSNYTEARNQLELILDQDANNTLAKYYMAVVLLRQNQKDQARQICEELLSHEPDNYAVIHLAINVDLADSRDNAAEEKAELLQSMYPEDSDAHLAMARVKLSQRNYDRALVAANKALELDPENEHAYSLKISIGGLLGDSETNKAIQEAIHLNPENPSLIANQGYQLIREGKVEEGLDRLKDALSRDPNNELARYGMMEGLKARFWPYRMFMKFGEWSAKMSEKGSWTFIIGAYVVYRILGTAAENNPDLAPFLWPLVYGILFLFILTWILVPLMNLYLLLNPYGQLLLDKDDKLMARLTGAAFGATVIFGTTYLLTGIDAFSIIGLVCFVSMIPLGTFLNPKGKRNRQITTAFAIGIPALAIIGTLLNNDLLYFGALIGLFAYQWVINGIIIKENSRTFD